MKRALLSVWDKTGLDDLAGALRDHGVEILASGGTGKALAAAGIGFLEIAEYTGSPEMMDGRVKTLHPKIHGGLLGRRGIDDEVMAAHGIRPIDLLVANLYPFERMASQGLPLAELMEFVDIGGPAMIRAAAKNHRDVAVVVDPADYPLVTAALGRGGFSGEERLMLARKAFARTAGYDAAIANHLYSLDSPSCTRSRPGTGGSSGTGRTPTRRGRCTGRRASPGRGPSRGRRCRTIIIWTWTPPWPSSGSSTNPVPSA